MANLVIDTIYHTIPAIFNLLIQKWCFPFLVEELKEKIYVCQFLFLQPAQTFVLKYSTNNVASSRPVLRIRIDFRLSLYYRLILSTTPLEVLKEYAEKVTMLADGLWTFLTG